MKKTWEIPEIETLAISTTSYDTLQGTDVDGQWLNHEECKWYDSYNS